MSPSTSQSWIEVEIRAPRQTKKAVRDALRPFVLPNIQEKHLAQGDIWSIIGIMAADTLVDDRLVNIERGLRQVEQALDLNDPLFMEIVKIHAIDDWKYGRQAKTAYRGGRFVITTPGHAVQAHPDKTVLRITAGQAFGDGSHSSTRVALQIIDRLFQGDYGPFPTIGWSLDAGCGTGVLALATATRWKGKVVAVDISGQAMKRVKANLALNRPWGSQVLPVHGELSCCAGPFSVILANLVPSVQVTVHETLWAVLESGGWLVLAGFQEAQKELVTQLYLANGANAKACLSEEGWVGLLFRKPALPQPSKI